MLNADVRVSRPRRRRPSMLSLALLLLSLVLLLLWAYDSWRLHSDQGLCTGLGNDYCLYLAQARLLRAGRVGDLYNIPAMKATVRQITAEARAPGELRIPSGLVPYPPLFAWLVTPFTRVPPLASYALWSALNLAAAAWLAWRAAQLAEGLDKRVVVLLLLASWPLQFAFFLGQPMIVLACAVGELYLSLRAGRDFRGGLWLACLFFKPQYGLLLGALLLWKRRWAAVAGAALGVAGILAGSLLAAGLRATALAFPQAVRATGDDFHGHMTHATSIMVNWRAMVLALAPQDRIDDRLGLALTIALSGLTVLAVALALRGRWAPLAPWFPAQFTLVLLATLFVSYHSVVYGPVLLAVPLAAALAAGARAWLPRAIVVAGIAIPALLQAALHASRRSAEVTTLCMLALFAVLLVVVWAQAQAPAAGYAGWMAARRGRLARLPGYAVVTAALGGPPR